MRNLLNNISTIGNSIVSPIVKLFVRTGILRSVCARLAQDLCVSTTQLLGYLLLGDLRLTLRHWSTATSGLKPAVAVCSVVAEHRRWRHTIMCRPTVD